jgi:hypothetical protein
MKDFKRVFKYIWPQWHRLVTIGCSALLIGILFSFSIATVLPLLKVMMGEEGLHGWIYRKVSENRYGLSFYVPDSIELSDPNNPDVAYFLRIAGVKENSFAEQAGLKPEDQIVGAVSKIISPDEGYRRAYCFRNWPQYQMSSPYQFNTEGSTKTGDLNHNLKNWSFGVVKSPSMPITHKGFLDSYQKNGPERIRKRQ